MTEFVVEIKLICPPVERPHVYDELAGRLEFSLSMFQYVFLAKRDWIGRLDRRVSRSF